MAFGISGLDNISSLINLTFGMTQTGAAGLLAGLSGGSQSAISGINAQQIGQSYLNSITDQINFNKTELSLRNAASALNTANPNSSFNQIGAATSSSAAVSATTLANAAPGAYKVEISQLAQGQRNQGTALDANASAAIAAPGGYGQIEISANGKNELVTYQLNGTETNYQALNKMAAAINARGTGVSAMVTTSVNGGVTEARLNLTGATGADNGFTVRSTVGNGAEAAGVNAATNPAAVAQTAKNAQFTVNGVAFESASNTPVLGNVGIQLNLKQTNVGAPADINVTGGGANATQDIIKFVNQYNETLGKLQSNTSAYAKESSANLQSLSARNAEALSAVGVQVGSGGKLSVNEQQLKDAMSANPGAVSKAFNSGGFAAGVQAEAERAMNKSIASPTDTFNVTGGAFSAGLNYNLMIASNIGMFLNKLY